jgi:hypothetical protein
MFESPVLSQVVPAVILLFPSVMTQSAYQSGGKRLAIERRDPEHQRTAQNFRHRGGSFATSPSRHRRRASSDRRLSSLPAFT